MSNLKTFFPAKSSVQVLTLFPKTPDFDHFRHDILHEIKELGIKSVNDVLVGKMFFFAEFNDEEIDKIDQLILAENMHTITYKNKAIITMPNLPTSFICVAYKKQVSNPELNSLEYAIANLGISFKDNKKIQTATMFLLYGDISDKEKKAIAKMMINPSIQEELLKVPQDLSMPNIINEEINLVAISTLSDDELLTLSQENRLFLNLLEMQTIQAYFKKLKREPTDCEIEIIAQAWSEHCGHKTFKADIVVNGQKKLPLYTRLKNLTKEINHPDVLSCFVDNAGVIRFDEEDGICIKAETHNAPSAIEPFGGAETGVGGVIRDILGTGLGAKPIAVMDVLCFGDINLKNEGIPAGCLHPKNLLRKVVAGIQSYGNKVGLPNIGGATYFDNSFRAKPVVLAGAIGLIPIDKAKKGKPKPGDAMICLGGKTGRDGIHGVTFSSGHMTDKTKTLDSAAVQIGYPVLKRQVMDVLDKLCQKNLIHAITDCGGGGLSSVTTEMCEHIGGSINLEAISTKYQGLRPWELLLSESQERMVIAIDPKHTKEVLDLCHHYGINADRIGTFSDNDNILKVNYKGKKVAELDLKFVLDDNPQKTITGYYYHPVIRGDDLPALNSDEIKKLALGILNHLNVCSKESVIRKYDHVVSGCTVSPYFQGKNQDTPQDSLVLKPKYNSKKGLMTTFGLAPEIGVHHTYSGGITAVIEAVANAIARGADLNKMFLIDNFIYPNPDNHEDIGNLDRLLEGILIVAEKLGTPFISGKDSLGGTYKGADGSVIKIKPTVVITALSVLADADKIITSHFQSAGNQIVLFGNNYTAGLGGSILIEKLKLKDNQVPNYDLFSLKDNFLLLQDLIAKGIVLSCHDMKEGGLFTCLAEMSLGNNIGIDITLDNSGDNFINALFNEAVGKFILEIPANIKVEEIMGKTPYRCLGFTTAKAELNINQQIKFTHSELKQAYHNQSLEEILPLNLATEHSSTINHTKSVMIRNNFKATPNVLVVKAPGTNSERETAESFNKAGGNSKIVDIADLKPADFKSAQILVIPGGFSYGDDIYAGKIFSLDLLNRFADEMRKFAEDDKLIMGICNGFQVLVRTGLLPNRTFGKMEANLLHNDSGQFTCRNVDLRIEPSICKWTQGLANKTITVPIAHGEGKFFTTPTILNHIETNKQVVFRYIDNSGQNATTCPSNPNGSLNAIAGITDPSGRILGMMPHPERDARNFSQILSEDFIGLDIIRGGIGYFGK